MENNKNKRRICEICNKTFANGKALGGHIRSHFVKFPIAPKPNPDPIPAPVYPIPPSPKSLISSSSQFFSPEKSDLSNAESIRSKRRCKSREDLQVQSESLSSVYEDFPDEEVAVCLLKLKSDKWTKEGTKEDKRGRDEDYFYEDHDEKEASIYVTSTGFSKSQLKYKCRTCKKRFRTYQALGGHRASHKNSKMYDTEDEDEDEEGRVKNVFGVTNMNYVRQGSFECPFCDKVFESGKALGGHKKVHFAYLAVAAKKPGVEEAGKQHNFLDLNLLPEEEDDEFNA